MISHCKQEKPIEIPNSMIRESLSLPQYDYSLDLPGIELIERGGVNSNGYNCSSFVFDKEEWYSRIISLLLFDDCAINILAEAGYSYVNIPISGDVVVYMKHWNTYSNYAPSHYGRLISNNLVESKFGENHGVFRHELEHVPIEYGSYYTILRKVN